MLALILVLPSALLLSPTVMPTTSELRRTRMTTMIRTTRSSTAKVTARKYAGIFETKWQRPGWLPDVDDDTQISDSATAVRWIGVQGSIDMGIVLLFCYHSCGGHLDQFTFQDAVEHPELKFLILMPAVTVFFQILRRFAPEVDEIRNFDNDPIVAYLGGPAKIRDLRDRYNEAMRVCDVSKLGGMWSK